MKKLLVISGSPRRNGNTMHMVNKFVELLKEKNKNYTIETIYLIEKNLGYCLGCNSCLLKGPEKCLKKDDAHAIMNSMKEADCIVFATPGYSHMVSGLMKNFLDRFMFLDHMPELIGKPVVIISTTGGDGINGAPNFMKNMAITWWGCNILDSIGIGHAFYVLNEKHRVRALKRLKRAAYKFDEAVKSNQLPVPSFKQYMTFVLNRTECIVSPDSQPFRYKYWVDKGWLKSKYYYEVRLNPIFPVIGVLSEAVMKRIFVGLLGKDANQKLASWTHQKYDKALL